MEGTRPGETALSNASAYSSASCGVVHREQSCVWTLTSNHSTKQCQSEHVGSGRCAGSRRLGFLQCSLQSIGIIGPGIRYEVASLIDPSRVCLQRGWSDCKEIDASIDGGKTAHVEGRNFPWVSSELPQVPGELEGNNAVWLLPPCQSFVSAPAACRLQWTFRRKTICTVHATFFGCVLNGTCRHGTLVEMK